MRILKPDMDTLKISLSAKPAAPEPTAPPQFAETTSEPSEKPTRWVASVILLIAISAFAWEGARAVKNDTVHPTCTDGEKHSAHPDSAGGL